jgi:hypothetical protein
MAQLLELLKEADSKKKSIKRDVFLAQADEIKEALEAGYTQRAIWTLLRDKGLLSSSYAWFCQNVATLINPDTGRSIYKKAKAGSPKFRHSPFPDKDLI